MQVLSDLIDGANFNCALCYRGYKGSRCTTECLKAKIRGIVFHIIKIGWHVLLSYKPIDEYTRVMRGSTFGGGGFAVTLGRSLLVSVFM